MRRLLQRRPLSRLPRCCSNKLGDRNVQIVVVVVVCAIVIAANAFVVADYDVVVADAVDVESSPVDCNSDAHRRYQLGRVDNGLAVATDVVIVLLAVPLVAVRAGYSVQ